MTLVFHNQSLQKYGVGPDSNSRPRLTADCFHIQIQVY